MMNIDDGTEAGGVMRKSAHAMMGLFHHARSMLILIVVSAGPIHFAVDSLYGAAVESSAASTFKRKANSEEGRQIYNGKGFCYQCHGYDGYIGRLPEMPPEMRDTIERMDPRPSDFRNAATLKLKNDADRFDAIKNGHRGTAMFPHKYLADSEINNLLAYLSTLRSERQHVP